MDTFMATIQIFMARKEAVDKTFTEE
jgi:hypothetical protein